MTWVSERHLVAAISNGGGFGVIACGVDDARRCSTRRSPPPQALTEQPFGVNLITLHPDLIELIDVCTRAAGSATSCWPAACPRGAGDRAHQGRRRAAGVLRPGAGDRQEARAHGRRRHHHRGHGGGRPYRPGFDRRPGAGDTAACRPRCRCSSPAASAAARRSLSYLEMGAAGVQLGTRFVCAHESIAHPRFKQRLHPRRARATPCPRCSSMRAFR